MSYANDLCNRVFNKDVLEVLKQLPDECLDMVYGDPDYNVGILELEMEIKMSEKRGDLLEESMDNFIAGYLSGMFEIFIDKDEEGNAHVSDIFDCYCETSNSFDIFCEKLEEQKNKK